MRSSTGAQQWFIFSFNKIFFLKAAFIVLLLGGTSFIVIVPRIYSPWLDKTNFTQILRETLKQHVIRFLAINPNISTANISVRDKYAGISKWTEAVNFSSGIRFMTIRWQGRLGNNMFMYASLYGIARNNGFMPFISKQGTFDNAFKLRVPLLNFYDSLNFSYFREDRACAYDGRTRNLKSSPTQHVQLEGFFQSWKYFQNYSNEIRSEFTFHNGVLASEENYLRRILDNSYPHNLQDSVVFIGVHVRLGDMASESAFGQGYTIAPFTYLKSAISYFKSKFNYTIFVVCSDSIDETRTHFSNIASSLNQFHKIVFSEDSSAIRDLALLSLCNHTIMTVGTFGWWAGWLAGGEVVYYKGFPRPKSSIAEIFNATDYFLPKWTGLS